jgi:methyl-accepting chemotaxis protein
LAAKGKRRLKGFVMLNTLRVRLILSHVLPSLVTVPIMGIALLLLLDSQLSQINQGGNALIVMNGQLQRLRCSIVSVVSIELILASFLGWGLALVYEAPLHKIIQAIRELANSQRLVPIPEEGPTEIKILLNAVNKMAKRLNFFELSRRQLLDSANELGIRADEFQSTIQISLSGMYKGIDTNKANCLAMLDELKHFQSMLNEFNQFDERLNAGLETQLKSPPIGDDDKSNIFPNSRSVKTFK